MNAEGMIAEAELIEAASSLANLIESLHHPRHAVSLVPIRRRIKRIFVRQFARQERAFLRESEYWLRWLSDMFREADADEAAKRAQMQDIVTARINAGTALTSEWADTQQEAFDAAVRAAARAASKRMRLDYEIKLARDAGNRYAQQHLRKRGFKQLAKDIDATSRKRMADAVADTYVRGGSFNDAVDAIEKSFTDMKTSRAEMIAKTELADAYNSAMLESAREAGGMLKTWNAEGPAPCPICVANEDEGAIPLEQEFQSGDDAPPQHPRCMCSVGFVKA